ncbi:gamma-glutamyl-gamma-aminobutyrate hydrolase family protein [Pseudomonas sp. LS1212]|nr:gamma-glutamyl-gamma-aminobutyrate hydrolase family protein [Pseudomonas sp. LS1212]UVJ43849.1 gamma-glutamyl-gamma-aminobutyrate hydrolase family protein [Pseudomonas sp. LS1212]
MSRLPTIGVTTCSRQIGLHAHHSSGAPCVRTAAATASGVQLSLPSLAGSPNIEPYHYSGPASALGTVHDSEHVRTTLPLIRPAVAIGMPAGWQVREKLQYLDVFQGFGDACRKRAIQRDADASKSA